MNFNIKSWVHSAKTGMLMISWRLKQVMTKHNIRADDLAKEMGLGIKAIGRLRKPIMPEINHDKWDALMLALNKLKPKEAPFIRVADLVEHAFTPDELETIARPIVQAKDDNLTANQRRQMIAERANQKSQAEESETDLIGRLPKPTAEELPSHIAKSKLAKSKKRASSGTFKSG